MRKSEKKNQAYAYHLQEWSYQEIADELLVSKTTAYRWVMEQRNIRDTGTENNNSTEENEFGKEAAPPETSTTTNKHNDDKKQHIIDNNLPDDASTAPSKNDIELKIAEMEHEYRMAQIKLEERKLANNSFEQEDLIIKSNIPENVIIINDIPDKLPDIKKEDPFTAISSRIIENFNRNIEKNAKSEIKRKEDIRQIELLKENAKYLIPYDLRLSIEDLINDYLELNNKPIRKAQATQFSHRISEIITTLRTLARTRVAKVKKYTIWQTLMQIESDFAFVLSDFNNSFLYTTIFEIDEEWANELQAIKFEKFGSPLLK